MLKAKGKAHKSQANHHTSLKKETKRPSKSSIIALNSSHSIRSLARSLAQLSPCITNKGNKISRIMEIPKAQRKKKVNKRRGKGEKQGNPDILLFLLRGGGQALFWFVSQNVREKKKENTCLVDANSTHIAMHWETTERITIMNVDVASQGHIPDKQKQ